MLKKTINIPATRDPFINAQLIPAGTDSKTGEARFWSSTWNSNVGSTGVLINESGKNTVVRFDSAKGENGFYGASYQGDDILWMSSFLDRISRFDLRTTAIETYDTGMPSALSLSGLTVDVKTKKVFCCAYCQTDLKRKAYVFDTVSKQTIRSFEDIPLSTNQLRFSVQNLDGSYTFVNLTPDLQLLKWDPNTDEVRVLTDPLKIESSSSVFKVIRDEKGRILIPDHGWYDVKREAFVEKASIGTNACWFAKDGDHLYGADHASATGSCVLLDHDLTKGRTRQIATVSDTMSYHFEYVRPGKIVALNMYGFFYRIDIATGALETTARLNTDSIGHIDCLHRIDKNRILATPFITQRFFEIHINENKGYDLGRATGGVGEVLLTIPFRDKIYMASYTKGYLTEYDPNRPAYFPENPRPVVCPPKPAMRPVGYCTDAHSIYYSCSRSYGLPGSMMIKYTPDTGKTVFVDEPVKNQMIRDMWFDDHTRKIIGVTTVEADCRSCPAVDVNAKVVVMDPISLRVEQTVQACHPCSSMKILGVFDTGRILILQMGGQHTHYVLLDPKTMEQHGYDPSWPVDGTPMAAKCPNRVLVVRKDEIIFWDAKHHKNVRAMAIESGCRKVFVHDHDLYLVYKQTITLLENALE